MKTKKYDVAKPKDVYRELAHRLGVSETQAKEIFETVFDVVQYFVLNKKAVKVKDFATFYPFLSSPKWMRTSLGTTTYVGWRYLPKVKFAKAFRDTLKSVEVEQKDNIEVPF